MKALFILICGILSSCAIEKPKYESIQKDGNFEVRKYEAIKVVSAPMEDMGKRDQSFRKLFKYISGENEAKQKIAMTSPVFMDEKNDKAASSGKMSFMIPAEVAEKGAPAPDGEGVEVTEIIGGTYAVLRFKGWDKPDNRKQGAEALAKLISEKKLKPMGSTFFAFYDPPWTPEFMRRNEIWQRIKP
ncbi:heme-binding protein [Akkermansiaceae bacterium]|nr:heme-binding protein [Akkermansiaceae bacterium]